MTSLRAGLIAGAIGLALVLLYSLFYYRVLGILTALSLVQALAPQLPQTSHSQAQRVRLVEAIKRLHPLMQPRRRSPAPASPSTRRASAWH